MKKFPLCFKFAQIDRWAADRADGINGVFIWKDVQLKPGENQTEAKAMRAGKSLSDSCVWTLRPAQ